METAGSRDSRNCADLAQGMAFTGCRKGEVAEIRRSTARTSTLTFSDTLLASVDTRFIAVYGFHHYRPRYRRQA